MLTHLQANHDAPAALMVTDRQYTTMLHGLVCHHCLSLGWLCEVHEYGSTEGGQTCDRPQIGTVAQAETLGAQFL
jgi:hypothetical protein